MKIHPTAIVETGAELEEEVEIGPYACIGAKVRIGPRTIVQSHAVIEGAVRIGADNLIGHGAIVGAAPQDLTFESGTPSSVEIGNHNTIREHVTIHRGTAANSATRIGDDNFLMAGAHLGHNCTLGNKVIIANNCLLGGYVSVADGAFLGGASIFHQFVRIGRLAMIRGGTALSKDTPPFVIAVEENLVAGLNVIGLRRAGFSAEERAEIRRAFRLLYERGLNISQALAQARAQTWSAAAREFFDFVAAARRGIPALRRTREAAASDDGG